MILDNSEKWFFEKQGNVDYKAFGFDCKLYYIIICFFHNQERLDDK